MTEQLKLKKMKELKGILGGNQEIRRNADAWKLRTEALPFINKSTQPNIYRFLEKRATELGITVEEYQKKHC